MILIVRTLFLDSDAMEEENNAEESSQSTLNSTNTGQEVRK